MTGEEEKLALMQEGGRRLAKVFLAVLPQIKPGATLTYINHLVEEEITKAGGELSFKMVAGYRWASCINLNQGVVHGVPKDRKVKEDDLVSLDAGFFYRGFHTDRAETIIAGQKKTKEKIKLVEAGKEALKQAIIQAKPANRVGHISRAIETSLTGAGFNPVRSLIGHGIGKKLHQEPAIPCYLEGKIEETPELLVGMNLAIEVIYTAGNPDLVELEDGWTIETADGKIAGLFEETVAVTGKGPQVLTELDSVLTKA